MRTSPITCYSCPLWNGCLVCVSVEEVEMYKSTYEKATRGLMFITGNLQRKLSTPLGPSRNKKQLPFVNSLCKLQWQVASSERQPGKRKRAAGPSKGTESIELGISLGQFVTRPSWLRACQLNPPREWTRKGVWEMGSYSHRCNDLQSFYISKSASKALYVHTSGKWNQNLCSTEDDSEGLGLLCCSQL